MIQLKNLKLISLMSLLVSLNSYSLALDQTKPDQQSVDRVTPDQTKSDQRNVQRADQTVNPTKTKQEQISQMLQEFLNTSCQPTKGFEAWIDELKNLIQKEPEFATFFPVLNTIRNQKNANLVKLEILKNRGKAPSFVQKILSEKPIGELANILSARVKVRSLQSRL